MKLNDVGQKVCFLFLGLNSSLEFGDLDSVVCGQCECRGSNNKGGDVPLLLLTFWNMWEAGEKILGEFEDLYDVGLVEF